VAESLVFEGSIQILKSVSILLVYCDLLPSCFLFDNVLLLLREFHTDQHNASLNLIDTPRQRSLYFLRQPEEERKYH